MLMFKELCMVVLLVCFHQTNARTVNHAWSSGKKSNFAEKRQETPVASETHTPEQHAELGAKAGNFSLQADRNKESLKVSYSGMKHGILTKVHSKPVAGKIGHSRSGGMADTPIKPLEHVPIGPSLSSRFGRLKNITSKNITLGSFNEDYDNSSLGNVISYNGTDDEYPEINQQNADSDAQTLHARQQESTGTETEEQSSENQYNMPKIERFAGSNAGIVQNKVTRNHHKTHVVTEGDFLPSNNNEYWNDTLQENVSDSSNYDQPSDAYSDSQSQSESSGYKDLDSNTNMFRPPTGYPLPPQTTPSIHHYPQVDNTTPDAGYPTTVVQQDMYTTPPLSSGETTTPSIEQPAYVLSTESPNVLDASTALPEDTTTSYPETEAPTETPTLPPTDVNVTQFPIQVVNTPPECPEEIESLGCFNNGINMTLFPEMIMTRGNGQTLEQFLCACANDVRNRQWFTFALEEDACYSGPEEGIYDEYGPSARCYNDNSDVCSDHDIYCQGSKGSSSVYSVLTPDHPHLVKS